MPEKRLQKTRALYRQLNAGTNPAGQALANQADFHDWMCRSYPGTVGCPAGPTGAEGQEGLRHAEPTAETPWGV